MPVDVEYLDLVDKPYLGRERIFPSEGDSEEAAEHREVLGVERVFSGPEFAHELSFREEDGFLRFGNDQLSIGAEIGFRKAPGIGGDIACGLPADKIDYGHR